VGTSSDGQAVGCSGTVATTRLAARTLFAGWLPSADEQSRRGYRWGRRRSNSARRELPRASHARIESIEELETDLARSALASFDVPFAPDVFSHGRQPQLPNQSLALPPEIAALNGKTVSIRGFMLPVEVKPGGVRKFVLTATIDSCHWGMIGLANEWVLVEMAENKHVPSVRFQPVVLFGRLSTAVAGRAADRFVPVAGRLHSD